MPIVRIDWDNEKLEKEMVLTLSEAVHKIVSETTGIADVPVYANSSEIKVKAAPVEIFVQMSAHKIKDVDVLVGEIKSKLSAWKQETSFPHPINLTFIPMDWKIEIDI